MNHVSIIIKTGVSCNLQLQIHIVFSVYQNTVAAVRAALLKTARVVLKDGLQRAVRVGQPMLGGSGVFLDVGKVLEDVLPAHDQADVAYL